MAPVQVGDQAPGFALQTVDGEQVELVQVLKQASAVLLVFLRHLG